MRLLTLIRQRWIRIALFVSVLVVGLFVVASNRFLYLSHQQFSFIPQWTHQTASARTQPLIIGHRGSGLPSERSQSQFIGNTRKAITNAISANVDWIEIDIRQTKDQELVLFHDHELIDKTTFQSGTVDSKTLKELRSCDVLTNPQGKLLSLKDVFGQENEFQANRRHWILDIKVAGIADDVLSLLKESKIPQQQVIIFGDHHVLEDYQDHGYRLGYTTLFSNHVQMFYSMDEIYKRCENHSCDLLVVPIVFVTPQLVRSAEERGIEVWSYGSNNLRDLEYCVQCGVKGIIVDTPSEAISHFRPSAELQ